MLLCNATLLRVDQPGTPTSGGAAGEYTQGPDLTVRCALVDPSFDSRRLIDAMSLQSTASLFVSLLNFASAKVELVPGARVRVLVDGEETAADLCIDHQKNRTKGTLTHVECFVRKE